MFNKIATCMLRSCSLCKRECNLYLYEILRHWCIQLTANSKTFTQMIVWSSSKSQTDFW